MKIVITGTSRGIGLALASQALSAGHHVLAVARQPENSPDLQELKKKAGASLTIVKADVADAAAPATIARAVESWPCVDLLINNAGIYAETETVEDFLESFRVNSIAPLLIVRALQPKLEKSKQPKLIQITSLMGSIADNNSGGSYAYRASKAALNMITKSLAQDEKWLTCAVIHPGWVQTRMGGPDAPISTEESARGIWQVIQRLTPADSGIFVDYEGDRLPW
jgi:NAD(P)-dependent dehydrogenase (short-subunit alcohol dehydrogenase family)